MDAGTTIVVARKGEAHESTRIHRGRRSRGRGIRPDRGTISPPAGKRLTLPASPGLRRGGARSRIPMGLGTGLRGVSRYEVRGPPSLGPVLHSEIAQRIVAVPDYAV